MLGGAGMELSNWFSMAYFMFAGIMLVALGQAFVIVEIATATLLLEEDDCEPVFDLLS